MTEFFLVIVLESSENKCGPRLAVYGTNLYARYPVLCVAEYRACMCVAEYRVLLLLSGLGASEKLPA